MRLREEGGWGEKRGPREDESYMVRLQRRRFEAVSEPREFGTGSRETSPDIRNKRPCCGSHLSKTAVEYILCLFFVFCRGRAEEISSSRQNSFPLWASVSRWWKGSTLSVFILKIMNAGSACVHVGLSPTAFEKVYLLVRTRAKKVKGAVQLFCNA